MPFGDGGGTENALVQYNTKGKTAKRQKNSLFPQNRIRQGVWAFLLVFLSISRVFPQWVKMYILGGERI